MHKYTQTINNNNHQQNPNSIGSPMEFPSAYPTSNGAFVNYQVQQGVIPQSTFNPTATYQPTYPSYYGPSHHYVQQGISQQPRFNQANTYPNMGFPGTTNMEFPEQNYNPYATVNPLMMQTNPYPTVNPMQMQTNPYQTVNPMMQFFPTNPFATFNPQLQTNQIAESFALAGYQNNPFISNVNPQPFENQVQYEYVTTTTTVVEHTVHSEEPKVDEKLVYLESMRAQIENSAKSIQLHLESISRKIQTAETFALKMEKENVESDIKLASEVSKLYDKQKLATENLEKINNELINADMEILKHKSSSVIIK